MEPNETGRIVSAAADGDAAAWKALVDRFSGLVWSVTRGYRLNFADAADVFQTVWLRLAEHLNRIENREHVGAWLATTAKRESLRVARGSARVVPTEDTSLLGYGNPDDNSPEQVVLDLEQAVIDDRRAELVWRAFRELSERCQTLLRILMATPPPNYADVAAALDMPVGSIGPTRARCLQQLRRRLGGGDVSGSM